MKHGDGLSFNEVHDLNAKASQNESGLSELAFYYPGHLWLDGEWIKNLLLFFDGIALLVPEYKRYEPQQADPSVAGVLADEGLLHILPADVTVNSEVTNKLADAMEKVFERSVLEELDPETQFHSLSFSRLGWFGAREVAEHVLFELRRRNLARESEDGVSVPMHPTVRVLILTLLAQIIRANAASRGLDLAPATDRPEMVEALTFALTNTHAPTSAGQVVSTDIETIGVDLSLVPLHEVLAFRRQNLKKYRAYAKSVRQFVVEVSMSPEFKRERLFQERRSEITDLASDLRSLAARTWKKRTAVGLGVAGAATSMGSGPAIAGILGILAAIAGYERSAGPVSAYSYIFQAKKELR